MAYPNNLAEYRMMFSAGDEAEAESKLGLLQAFSKLYEHDRDFLDDMLAVDASASAQLSNYIQGIVCDEQVYIISNLATGKSQSFYSTDKLWTLGRDPRQSDLAVPDRRLSRCHAALQFNSEQGFIISDLESTNGTYVNGKKLQRVYALNDGDRIRIGSSLFHFFYCNTQSNPIDTDDTSTDNPEGGRTLH
ncbi:MAG: FHA domain-containing protein [Leptolyngbyaceae cyanobacterium MAG.088]|nr:FHA domain-containing protein [Leptolyngbyaceae cyanobacterium MAG.088]